MRRRIAERMVPLIGPDAWAVDEILFTQMVSGIVVANTLYGACNDLGLRTPTSA